MRFAFLCFFIFHASQLLHRLPFGFLTPVRLSDVCKHSNEKSLFVNEKIYSEEFFTTLKSEDEKWDDARVRKRFPGKSRVEVGGGLSINNLFRQIDLCHGDAM